MAETPAPSIPQVSGFKGINNRLDPVRLGLEYQLQADNVLCDDAGFLTLRPGLKMLAPGYMDAYGTRNGRLLLVTDGGALVERMDDGSEIPLASGLDTTQYRWAELGYALFAQGGSTGLAIYPHYIIPWGELCPPPPIVVAGQETLYPPLGDPISYPPPNGQVLSSRRNQLVVGVWEPERDRSVLYYSRPDFPHEFRLDRDYQLIPGRITLLTELPQGLVIGTDRAIYTDPIDSPLQRVADYGVPPNALAHDDRSVAYFWSERGLCKCFPFENLTDKNLAVEQRQWTAAGILPYQGSTYAVISQTGKVSKKQLTQPMVPLKITSLYHSHLLP